MDWKDFIASLVSSLAWPVAAAIAVFLLREQIRVVLQQPLKRFAMGSFELEWGQGAATVLLGTASSGAPKTAPDYSDELRRMAIRANDTPVPTVVTGFALVERDVHRIAYEVGIEPGSRGVMPLAMALQAAGAINQETVAAVQGLATLRNLAVNDDGSGLAVTPERAREYVALVEATLFALSRATVPSAPALAS